MTKTEVINIEVNLDIPEAIRKNDSISNTQKVEMARRVNEGLVELQKTNPKAVAKIKLDSKLELIYEMLVDQCLEKGKTVSIDQIMEVADTTSSSSVVMQKLNKHVRKKEGGTLTIKKFKRGGKNCYQLTKVEINQE